VQDGAAVTGLLIAGASLVAVNNTGNAIYDPIGSIIIGNLLGMVRDVSFLSTFMHNFLRVPYYCPQGLGIFVYLLA
jgi:hypothetical protein